MPSDRNSRNARSTRSTQTSRNTRTGRTRQPDTVQPDTARPDTHEWWTPPADRAALHEWIRTHAGVTLATQPLIDGHAAPFEYIAHTFFEGARTWAEALEREAPPEADAAPPPDPGRSRPRAESRKSTPDTVVWASRGGGKTFLAALATVLDMIFKPGVQVRLLGGSLEQSRRVHAHLRSLFERPSLAWTLDGAITEKRVRLVNGSACEVLAQSERSVRGTRVQKLRCDEVELFNPEVWEAAQLTTRSAVVRPVGGGELRVRGAVEAFSTMHRPFGLMFQVVKEASGGRRRLFKWGTIDVLGACGPRRACTDADGRPRCSLWAECRGRAKRRDADGHAPGHVEVADAVVLRRRVGRETWETEMLCLRPSRRDRVLPEFDPEAHVFDGDPPEEGVWVAGMDFGFRNPTVVVWAVLEPGGALRVVGERIASGVVLDGHIEAIHRAPWPTPAWLGVDPAGRQRNGQTGLSDTQRLRAAGLRVRDRRVPMAEGLGLIRARLRPAAGPPRLFVHRRCTGLIESLVRYRYPAHNLHSDTPVKDGPDHAVDALRYLIQNLDAPCGTLAVRYS